MAQRLGAPYSEWGVFHRFHLASAKFMFGAWDESLEDISEAMKLAHRIGHSHGLASLLAARTMVAVLRGDFSRAEASICEAKTASHTRRTGDRRVFGLVDVAEVALALERGQVERALGIAVDFVRTSAWVAPRASLALGCIPMGLMWLAEAQVAAGQPQSALETARLILGLGPTGAPYLTALSSRAEGLARQALGEWQDAIVCLSRSQETFADLAMPFEAAKSLFEEATAAAAWRPDLASGAAQQSLVMFERLGAQHYIAAALRLLQRLALSKPATGRPCLAGVIVSGRELEIAQLVAEGLTDVQIAHRLTLSPLTVSTYLRNLYARVGIGSRAALARLVAEAGHLSG
ncbi:MAG: helix-turn-helix transcriptional regulator [Chloroflexi bacterium]|nr:helix-turn-helix transcriptional regulator [Chloroflexota bacterium]